MADTLSQPKAARLNHLLFEVVTVVKPHVAYACVSESHSALHTFARAGRGARTRGETKSQVTRCPYLSEPASIPVECFPFPEGGLAPPVATLTMPRASGGRNASPAVPTADSVP